MGSTPCPSCGVPVAIGYPRCPKCHAVVPSAGRAKRVTFREEALAGGTTVEPPDTGASSGAWIWLALGAVAVAGVVAYFALRGGGSGTAASGAETDEDDQSEVTEPVGEAPVGEEPTARPVKRPNAPVDDGADRRRALATLDEQLRSDRMWATVSEDKGVVVIASSLCNDREMQPSIAKAVAALAAAGLTQVRCEELNGHVAFEEPLE